MANRNLAFEFDKIFPILGVFNGIAFSHRGIITLGWEVELPAAYTIEQSEYDALAKLFCTALQSLPEYYVVHKQDICLKETYKPEYTGQEIHDFNERTHAGKQYPTHRCYLYVSRTTRMTFLPKPGTCGLLGINNNKMPDDAEVARFRSECYKFRDILNTGIVKLRELTEVDWYGDDEKAGLISQVMFLGNTSPTISDLELNDDYVRSHGNVAQSFVIAEARNLPNELSNTTRIEQMSSHLNEVQLSLGSKLSILLPYEHIFNQVFMIPSQSLAMSRQNKKNKRMHGGADSVDNAINSEELDAFGMSAYKDSLFMVYASFNVLIWGKPEEQESITSAVNAAIQSMGIKAVMNIYDTPAIWYSSIPGVAPELSDKDCMEMESASAVQMVPWESYEKNMEGGLLTLTDRTRLIPIKLDIQKRAQQLNLLNAFNIFCVGPTGSGKSFTTNAIIRNHVEADEDCFVLDQGDSYEGLCMYFREKSGGRDGQYYAWDPERPYSFNPFQKFKQWSDEDNNGYQCLISILQLMWQPAGGWKSSNVPVLQKIVDDFIKEHANDDKDPIFDDFYRYVGEVVRPKILPKFTTDKAGNKKLTTKKPEEMFVVSYDPVTPDVFDISGFCNALSPFALGGKYSVVLNNREAADLRESHLVVFEIAKLAQTKDTLLYSICILCILNAFDDKMRANKNFKMMVIEEAWKALGEATTSSYMVELWKTARKYQCQAMVVTQQLSDIVASSTVRDTILANSHVQILLQQTSSEANIRTLKDLLGLSDKDINLILSINRNVTGKNKEVFIKWGDAKKGIYTFLASPEECLLYESDKIKKQPFIDKCKELGSVQAALNFFLNEKNS